MKSVLLGLVLSSVSAFAITTGCTGSDTSGGALTLTTSSSNSLFTGTGTDTCTLADGEVFSNFGIYGVGGTSYLLNVTVIGDTLNITTNNLTGEDLKIYFQTSSEPIGVILAAGGGDSVTETACDTAFNSSSGSEVCSGNLLLAGPSVVAGGLSCAGCSGVSANINFSNTGTDYFVKDDSGGSFVSQTFIPEPMTFSLVGVGLLGLGLAGRRLRRK